MECNQTDIEKWKEMDTALDKPFNELYVWNDIIDGNRVTYKEKETL
jgi:hypothetical protein